MHFTCEWVITAWLNLRGSAKSPLLLSLVVVVVDSMEIEKKKRRSYIVSFPTLVAVLDDVKFPFYSTIRGCT